VDPPDGPRKGGRIKRNKLAIFLFFSRQNPASSALVVGCLVLSGLAEGFGVAALLPLLGVLFQSGSAAKSGWLFSLFERLGIPATLYSILGFVLAGLLLKALILLLVSRVVSGNLARSTTRLRLELVQAVFHSRWSYFVRQAPGELASALSHEASRAASGYFYIIMLSATAVQFVTYATLTLVISWKIALGATLLAPMVFLLFRRLVRANQEAGARETVLSRGMVSRFTDILQGIKPLKGMGRTESMRLMLDKEARELNEQLRRAMLATDAMKIAQEPLMALIVGAGIVLAFGVGQIPVVTVFLMAFLFQRLVVNLFSMQRYYQVVAGYESAFWAVIDSTEKARAEAESSGGSPAIPAPREIVFKRVGFDYPGKPVLRSLNLRIRCGTFTVLLGPSGAGKTTLLDLVAGLHQPTRGQILLDEAPLASFDLQRWRQQLGYVPQEMLLFNDSVFNNLALGDPALTEADAWAALKQAGAHDFVKGLPGGLRAPVGERGAMLSGGQRQRLSLARALIRKPRLLILDEITASLDRQTQVSVLRTLRGLTPGVTLFCISHQESVARVADQVITFGKQPGRVRMRRR